ncbi:mitochondrial F1-F0 ATP synthase subunit F of fungi-domain-containing protein [Xylariomycetidae sp. FL2044]|nr:mitochondrial F1-F0 ATP synthase subunit F of fungi-domain-containing protein [Xylariomycetidae sp. FL2044]
MSFVTRRALSTLIPPKVASPSAIGAAPDAVRMKRVVSFYEKLPRGPAPEVKATGLLGRYQAKHFTGKNASAKPIIHAVGLILVVGYPMTYYFHLRHHKNNAH